MCAITNHPIKVVFRISSSRPPTSSEYRKSLHQREAKNELAREYTHVEPMDLRKSAKKLILHSDEQMRDKMATWYSKDSYQGLTFSLLPRTIFQNQLGMRNRPLPNLIQPPKQASSAIAVTLGLNQLSDGVKENGDCTTNKTVPKL